MTSGDCGILLDPPFRGYVGGELEDTAAQQGALKPVKTIALPYLVVG